MRITIRKLQINCEIIKNNDNCDLGNVTSRFSYLGNIPKYFHKRETDLAEIMWFYDLSYLWKSKIHLY